MLVSTGFLGVGDGGAVAESMRGNQPHLVCPKQRSEILRLPSPHPWLGSFHRRARLQFIRHEFHLYSTPRKGSLFICHLYLCSLHTVFSTSIDRMVSVTTGRTQKFAARTKEMSERARQMAAGQILSQLLCISWSSTQRDTSLSWIVTPALLVVKWPHGTQKGDLEKAVTSEKSKITSGWSTDLRCQLRAELRSRKGLFTDYYIHLGFLPSSEIIHSRSYNLRSGKHFVNCIGQNRLAFSWAPHVPPQSEWLNSIKWFLTIYPSCGRPGDPSASYSHRETHIDLFNMHTSALEVTCHIAHQPELFTNKGNKRGSFSIIGKQNHWLTTGVISTIATI